MPTERVSACPWGWGIGGCFKEAWCLENGEIDLFGLHNESKITIVDKCTNETLKADKFNVLAIPRRCLNTSQNYMEVGSVEMRFKAVNDINAPDINTIYVGDEFFMYIKYKGSQTYSVVPKKCIAFKGTIISAGENQVELWDWRKSPNKCTRAKELLESFSIASPTVIYAKMYGFRFADSNFITIQCEVGVYPDQQKLLCSDDAMNAASKSVDSSRRRREIDDIKIKTKFAFAKLHVFDNKDIYLMENKSGKKAVQPDIFELKKNIWILDHSSLHRLQTASKKSYKPLHYYIHLLQIIIFC
uniref:Uncharacterized protein n=1 Tax=Magallana gigas TaxID=29159 RepID=K1QQ81_MAGGI